MRMEIGLNQALLQKQILSPQMIQSMEILVLNSLQLEEKIEQELEENVALELVEPATEAQDSADAASADTDSGGEAPASTGGDLASDPAPATDEVTREIDLLRDRYEHLSEFQSEEYYNSPGRVASGVAGGDDDDRFDLLQNAPNRPESLQDHLLGQVQLREGLRVRRRWLCQHLIFNLDPRGYMLYPLEEVLQELKAPIESADSNGTARVASPGSPEAKAADVEVIDGVPMSPVTEEELHEAYEVVRSLDPAGVAARDLEDCLLLQLERDSGEYPLEMQLIRSHLQDIARNRLPQIAKATGATLDEVKDAIEIIKSLDPIPGKEFASSENSYVRPDVLIDEDDGEFRVRVDNESLPRLRISPQYRGMLERAKKDPEVRKFIKKKIDNAEFLMHAIQQRRSTLQRVAEEVVKHQQDFFRKGARHLKPLKMQEIADIIGVNVSTVSRAISGKYFQSPGCIKELKFLFTGGTMREDGTMESRGSVIQRIHDLVDEEDKRKPLSDSKIVERLAKEGIHISRRTVTKYREAESIPSSRERREF